MGFNKPSSYRLDGLPPSIFGETYVFISIWASDPNVLMSEYSILTSRPEELLAQTATTHDLSGRPPELPLYDEGAAEAEALRLAQICLEDEIERRAIAEGRNEFTHSVRLTPCDLSPVSLWALNTHPRAIREMLERTTSNGLRNFLKMVVSTQRLRPAPR